MEQKVKKNNLTKIISFLHQTAKKETKKSFQKIWVTTSEQLGTIKTKSSLYQKKFGGTNKKSRNHCIRKLKQLQFK